MSGQDYNVTIVASPIMTSYTVGDSLMLTCMVTSSGSTGVNVTYSWQCSNCFAAGETDPTINQILTDMDNSTIRCSPTINGTVYMSDEFNLQVTQGT